MTNAQMKNINAYVEAFLTEHGDENMVELWQEATNQQNFIKLIKVDKKSSVIKKDPNKPKRGKSAYLFFCAEHREKAKKELGEGAKATEVTAELGRQWNELKASTKASDKKKLEKYEEQAREDKERYESEMTDYTAPPSDEEGSGKKKSSGNKDPNKPKRGKSAYLFFCAEHREKAKEELGDGAKATEVTAELGRQWNELKASTKAYDKKKLEKYEKQAREDKERYESEMVNYNHPSNDEDNEREEKEKEDKKEKKKAKEEKAKEEKEKKEKEKKEKEEKEKEEEQEEKKTGFELFCEEFREEIEQEAPYEAEHYYECTLLEMWNDLEEEEKQEWEERASM